MKAVILAGGFGNRISEESHLKPKPILWHIMKKSGIHGINELVHLAGSLAFQVHNT